MKRIYVNRRSFKEVATAMRRSREFVIMGANSMFCPRIDVKWLLKEQCIKWHGYLMTPGEIAKEELHSAFPDLKKVGWSGDMVKMLGHQLPMYCQEERVGNFLYVDIKAAYWQAYQNIWLDTAFPCGLGGKYDLAPVAYKLKDCKPARNALIGLIRSTRLAALRFGLSISIRSHNKYLSPNLWATVCTWLNEIAFEARTLGACYWMIDGGFFPVGSKYQVFLDWLVDYGIDHRSSWHHGHILGWLSYSMNGLKTTQPYHRGARGRVFHNKLYAGESEKIVKWNYQTVTNYRMERFLNGDYR